MAVKEVGHLPFFYGHALPGAATFGFVLSFVLRSRAGYGVAPFILPPLTSGGYTADPVFVAAPGTAWLFASPWMRGSPE
jgi:hypothetical protein